MEVVHTYLHINLHIYSYSVLWDMTLLHMFSFSPPILSNLPLLFMRVCVCVCVCLRAQIHWHNFAFCCFLLVMCDS